MQTIAAILLAITSFTLFWAWRIKKISNETLNALAGIFTIVAGSAAIILFVVPTAQPILVQETIPLNETSSPNEIATLTKNPTDDEIYLSDAPANIKSSMLGLSRDAIRILITYGNTGSRAQSFEQYCPVDANQLVIDYPGLFELEHNGLVVISTYDSDYCNDAYEWNWTELGKAANTFIFDVTANIRGEIRLAVEEELRKNGPFEIYQATSSLTPNAFRALLELNGRPISGYGLGCNKSEYDFYKVYPNLAELKAKGLAEFEKWQAKDCESGIDMLWKFTELAKRAYVYILDIVIMKLSDQPW